MNWLRAALRRLDPWAALLLGGLLAMGVVILLATPGPWQRVVGKEPPVHLEAPAPDDVAVFVMAGRASSCSGVLWLHVDAERHALTAVVVAPSVSGFSPTDGFAPVSAIADSAGPRAAAAALGGALGVSMDAWVALDRAATDLAVQAMVPMNDVKAARTRYRAARAAWRGRGDVRSTWPTQYETLRVALPQVQFQDLGVVAFANYVLGFGFVRSDLTLQGVTSLGEALRDVNRARVEVRAAPVIVERCRGGEVWQADASAVEPLRQSLASGIVPPESDRLVTVRERAARVLVVAPFARRAAQRYAAQVRAALARVGRRARAGGRRLGRRHTARLPRRARARPAPRTRRAGRAGRRGFAGGPEGVRDAAQPPAGGRRVRAAAGGYLRRGPGGEAAVAAGPAAGLVAARRAVRRRERRGLHGRDRRGAWPPRRGTTCRRWSAPAGRERSRRVCAPPPSASRSSRRATPGSGCWVRPSRPSAGMLQRLRLWGFPAARLTLEDGGWTPPAPGPLLCYRPGSRVAAAALAGDLGLSPQSVVRSDDSPRRLVLVLRD